MLNSITLPKPPQRADKHDLHFPRLARLAFLLEQIAKPYAERDPEMASILGPETEFDMTFVTIGQRTESGRFFVQRCDMVGLASLDPWFQAQGLSPSIITNPVKPDTLDPCGVMLFSERSGKAKRVSWRNTILCEFFGLGLFDWQALNDAESFWNRIGRVVVISPKLVLDALDAAVRMRYGVTLDVIRSRVEQDAAAA